MNGVPALSSQRRQPGPASQWTAGLGAALRKAKSLPHQLDSSLPLEFLQTATCLWLVVRVTPGIRIGIRMIFCPTGMEEAVAGKAKPSSMEFTAGSGMGRFTSVLRIQQTAPLLLRVSTSLAPAVPVKITATPVDLCVMDDRYDVYPGEARRYTCQSGNSAGQTFFAVPERKGASVFYLQNFSALADYCRHTGAKIAGTVHGVWPEEGFTLPSGESALPAGEPITINDAFVELRVGYPGSEADAAEHFMEALAAVYPALPQPETGYVDWPELAVKTLQSIRRSKSCCRRIKNRTYVQAYVDSDYKPPESMVQGCFLIALEEYERWKGTTLPLRRDLDHMPRSFFDPDLGILLRWLPNVPFKRSPISEEEAHYRMDSWYLLHTLVNLGRMAVSGSESAKETFLVSMATIIRTARHFEYCWPVFYDQRTLRIEKAETNVGQGGEQDANGLYVLIMLQAWTMTNQKSFLEEAEQAAEHLKGLAFGYLYQTNNTVTGAAALAWLWKITGKSQYRELALVALASTFSHLWLWDLGPGTYTFMALPPLHDAPYTALYEEAEIVVGLRLCQEQLGGELPESYALMIAEYQKHLLARGQWYFPPELPPEVLNPEPKEGKLKERLYIPLEGLGPPGEKAGAVGQAVYAAAAPLILAVLAWTRRSGVPFSVFCSYPVFGLEQAGDARAGSVRFRTGGVSAQECQIRLEPLTRRSLEVMLQWDEAEVRVWPARSQGERIIELPGNCQVQFSWH